MKTLKDLAKEAIDWYVSTNQDFSAHDVTERIRRVVNSTTDLLDLPRLTVGNKTFWNVDHEEVKKLVNGTFLAGELKRAFNGQYFVYESIKGRIMPLAQNLLTSFNRTLSGILPAIQTPAPIPSNVVTSKPAITIDEIDSYIGRVGPRTIKEIQGRFSKTHQVTCADIEELVSTSDDLDARATFGSQAVSKFVIYRI